MICRDCSKPLLGGFKQDDESFLCANCAIVLVERTTDKECFERIVEGCNKLLIPYKRATKKEIRDIKNQATAVLNIHFYNGRWPKRNQQK